MPIAYGTPGHAAAQFRNHLNHLLARTLTASPLVLVTAGDLPRPRVQLAFRQRGQAIEVPLRSRRYGRLWLWLGQTCESEEEEGQHRLRTVGYRYTLRADGGREPLLRWEYEQTLRPPARHCRHHIQGNIPLRIGRAHTSFNDLHVPTGVVAIEEVIRFCLVDLRVPPLSRDWHDALTNSYETFKARFAPRNE